MNSAVLNYAELLQSRVRQVRIYDEGNTTITDLSYLCMEDSYQFAVSFISNRKTIMKKLTIEQMKDELLNKKKNKLVCISAREYKEEIYYVLSEISKDNGVCTPFIENQDNIILFPELRYSDFGLIKHFCKQSNIYDYKILLASSY